MDDPTSAELPKAKRKHAKKARKKERRDKRREKKDRKKKGKDKFSADEAEGLDDNLHATEFQLGDRETDVAWSPDGAHPQEAEREPGFEVFYEMLVSELGRLREKVGDHERQLVDTAGPLIGRLPRPQQPYITGTCCCTKCCGRCCDMHEPITEDAGTDVDEEALDAEEADWRSRRKKNAPVEADMDTSSDFSYSGESSKGGKVRRTSTKLSRKKTDEVKRTPARTHIRSSPDLDTSSSELRRASLARISRKSLSKSKSASYRPGTLPSTKETPVRPLRDKLGEVEQLDAVYSFRQIPDLERLLRLDDTDDRELPRGRGLRDDPLGAPYGRWKSPTSNNAAFAWPPQKPYDNWSAGQIVYYAEPASEAFLRAVQSAPMNVYSARMPPEVIPPYATRQQYDEWPPYTPEAPLPYQERRLSPLTAAALELSGRADAVTRQARGTLEAARVLKRASDGALQIAMEGQYMDNGIYDRPPLEGRWQGRSILKSQLPVTKPLSSKDATSERSAEILSFEENRSIMRQPLSLGAAQKATIKPTEAESVGEAFKPDGRPRTRFGYAEAETTQKKPGIRRRGSMFVRGNVEPDDEGMSSSTRALLDEASTKMTVALNDDDDEPEESMKGERRKHETSQGKGKHEGFIVTDTWRKRNVVTVCDKSTGISMDQSTATPRAWTEPQKCCPPSLPSVCKCPSPLSFLSPCSTCAKEESEVSDTYLTPRSAQSMTSASQTSRPSSIESRKLSNANGFSEKKATHQKPAEKRKRKLSGAERRRSSLAEEKGHEEASLQRSTALAPSAEAVRNVNDLEKGDNLIATTKLSDALLNINPPDAGSEDVGGSSKRRGSRKESVGPRKPSTALESKPWRPSADASTGANRRRSSASETAAGAGLTATTERRRSSVAAEEKRQPRRDSGNLLRRESAQSERESVKLPVEAQPTSRHGSLRMHDNLAEPLRIVDMKQDAEEVPNAATVLLDDQAEDDAALRMDSDRSDLVRKLSLVKALQKRASFGEISGIEVRHSDLSAHGAGDVALEEDTGADESWAHEKTSEKKVASFQSDVSRLFLQTPEREAQLTAVVTVPYKQDAKLWCYKDSTRSLFPESRLGVTTAFVCAGWIILLIFLSEYHHNWFYIHTTSSLSQTTFSPSRATGPPPTYNPDIFTHRPTFPRGTTARPDTHQPMDIYFCATEHCDKEARYLFSSLKDNPCENFYENVCANSRSLWAQRYAGSAVSTTSLLAAQIQALTEEYIADDYNNDVKVARTLFSACVDWDEHREKSVAAALRMINEILGISWPVDSRARTFLPDPWHAAGELARKLNLEPLATLSVDVHPEKRRELILGLDEPSVLHRLNKGQDLRNLVATSVEEVTRRIDAKEIADAILETMFTISDLAAPPSVRVLGPENYRVTPLGEMGSRVKSMLSSVLAGYNIVEDSTGILVKSPSFFANLRAPNALTSGGLLNYLGYRVLLHFATFVSLPSLEQVRALVTRGYVNTGETTRRGLCSWEVSHVLPAMYTRAFFRRIRNTSFDVVARAWSSQIEQRFQSGLARLSWFREPRYSSADPADLHLANHKLSTSRIQHFYPSWIMNDAMYSKYEERVRARLDRVPTSAFAYLRALHEARFAEKIAPLAGSAADLAFSANIFDASPRYDVQRNSLFVPASMMNVSVPTNGSLFALHIARFGVRTMRALVAALYNDFVFSGRRSDGASDAPLLFTEGYDLRLRNTTRCLVDEYRRVPDSLKSSFMRGLSDLSAAAFSLLEQTVALMQAFWAFQEMLTVKRVWRSDFRFSLLPHMSSDQIFFVYYALDNCEASDDSYRARVFEERFELPPEERVNFPLLHMDAFKRAFGCPASSPMATASNCTVAS